MSIYLDNAATTAVAPEVIEVMYQNAKELNGNPSSTHSYGRKIKAKIEQVRKQLAQSLNASPLEIVFTSCGTESNNMVLKMAVETLGVQHIITTNFEHKCVLKTSERLAKAGKVKWHQLAVDKLGYISLIDLEKTLQSIGKEKALVSIMHANNEIGTLQDIEVIGNICEKYEAYFHSDTVQTYAHYPIDVEQAKIDFLAGSAHKFHGPKGVGFLYMRKDVKLSPLIDGGGQERGFRSGTENILGIVAMGKAIELAFEQIDNHQKHIVELKKYFKEQLELHIEGVAFNGDVEKGLYRVLNVSFPEKYNSDMFLFQLDMKGIAVSGGSACASGAQTASHVMQAIGHKPNRRSVRFSFAQHNTKAEIDIVVQVLKEMGESV